MFRAPPEERLFFSRTAPAWRDIPPRMRMVLRLPSDLPSDLLQRPGRYRWGGGRFRLFLPAGPPSKKVYALEHVSWEAEHGAPDWSGERASPAKGGFEIDVKKYHHAELKKKSV